MMTRLSRQLALVAAVTAFVVLAAERADAGLLRAALSQPPAAQMPAGPPGAPPAAVPMVAEPSAGACCPAPCITYRHRGLHRICSCCPPVETTLMVAPPSASCCCCPAPVCVPVCLPPCCLECQPTVSCRHCLLLGDIVTYDYACGVSVNVRFQHSGGILVTYRGV